MKLKYLLFAILLCFCGALHAQDILVEWKTDVRKSDNNVGLSLKGIIRKGWHIYPFDVKEAEIQGLQIIYPDSSIAVNEIIIKGHEGIITDLIFENRKINVITDSIFITQELKFTDVPENLQVKLQYYVGDKENFIPEEVNLVIIIDSTGKKPKNRILIPSININKPLADCGTTTAVHLTASDKGLMNLFLLGFLGGLLALLTPCVFPMIPLTVSFFTKKATTRRNGITHAFTYGFFIFMIYILLSLPFHFLDKLDPEILNNISTNVALNISFFVIFIVFAFSFFGYYEITLPARFSNSADSKSGAGNIVGIFFMALTLALVSFSCTGPILGSLLAGSLSVNGGAMQLTAGMGGFGLALALPFALFALFPNWLHSIPKSGGWLNTVKVVLGFAELALAFKFFSNADLVKQWGLLKREIFIGIWIVCGIGMSLYLFGVFSFKKEFAQKIGIGRKLFGVLVVAFTLYLIPGLTNTKYANLKLISGFPPPLWYSVYHRSSDCLFNLDCYSDYEEGLMVARRDNKPILLDFTGYACTNCRKMEESVWNNPDVLTLMHRFVVISLYVDDKKNLPLKEQFVYTFPGSNEQKSIKTYGDKWATFQTENFHNNSQPLYALINLKEELMNQPAPYTPSVKEYSDWLKCGLQTFNKK